MEEEHHKDKDWTMKGKAWQQHTDCVDRVVDVAAYGKATQHCSRTIGRQRRVHDAATC
jgi:hypothetical protein